MKHKLHLPIKIYLPVVDVLYYTGCLMVSIGIGLYEGLAAGLIAGGIALIASSIFNDGGGQA